MPAFKLLPACKNYIWGGQRLKTDFGIQSELDPLSEAWVLSCIPLPLWTSVLTWEAAAILRQTCIPVTTAANAERIPFWRFLSFAEAEN